MIACLYTSREAVAVSGYVYKVFDILPFRKWSLIPISLNMGKTWLLTSNRWNKVEVTLHISETGSEKALRPFPCSLSDFLLWTKLADMS